MKKLCFVFFLFLISILLQAQFKPAFNKKIPLHQNTWLSLHTETGRQTSMNEINRYSDLVPNPN